MSNLFHTENDSETKEDIQSDQIYDLSKKLKTLVFFNSKLNENLTAKNENMNVKTISNDQNKQQNSLFNNTIVVCNSKVSKRKIKKRLYNNCNKSSDSTIQIAQQANGQVISSHVNDSIKKTLQSTNMKQNSEQTYILDTYNYDPEISYDQQEFQKYFDEEGKIVEDLLISQLNDVIRKKDELYESNEFSMTNTNDFIDTRDVLAAEERLILKIIKSFREQMTRLTSMSTNHKRNMYLMSKIECAYEREFKRARAKLPFYAFRSEIIEALKDEKSDFLIITGETGSGKSSQVPQYLLESGLFNKDGKKIVSTQTRKLATISLTHRIRSELNANDSFLVAFKTSGDRRNENRFYFRENKLLLMTDKLLLREYKRDRLLKNYSCIIIDEAHDRTLFTDILLCELKSLVIERRKMNNPLKLIIMSATLDLNKLSNYFHNCPIIEVPGKTFPVKVFYEKMTSDYIKQTFEKIKYVIENRNKHPGHVLVFLPAIDDITKTVKMTEIYLENKRKAGDYIIFGLYGRMEIEDQVKIFEEYENKVKLIFSTNIAETSITINGVCTVIDSGRFKEKIYDQERNISILKLKLISQSSAIQRKGRAGRTSPGVCYRLYDENDFNEMDYVIKPEIFRMHLGVVVLQLLSCGIKNIIDYDLIDKPEREIFIKSIKQLKSLSMIDTQDENKITNVGLMAAEFYLEPTISRILIEGIKLGIGNEMAVIVSMMTISNMIYDKKATNNERDLSRLNNTQANDDFSFMLNIYNAFRAMKNFREKRDWCKKNSYSFYAFNLATQAYNELSSSVKFCMKHFNLKEDNPNQHDINSSITKSICSGLFGNLALYNGKLKNGLGVYKIFELNQEALIHFTSTLFTLSNQDIDNKFILFSDLIRIDDKLFIKNLLPVNLDILKSYTTTDFESIKQTVKETIQIEIDEPILNVFKSRNGEIIEKLESEVGCLLFFKNNYVEADVCVKNKSLAIKTINNFIEAARLQLEKEFYECKPSDLQNAKIIMKNGLNVHILLLHNEYIRLNIFDLKPEHTKEYLFKFFSTFGIVIDLNLYNTSGYVIFSQPEDAAKANLNVEKIISTKNNIPSFSIYPSLSLDGNLSLRNSSLKVTWFITPPTGLATLYCAKNSNITEIIYRLGMLGYIAKRSLDQDKSTILIENILSRDRLMDEIIFKELISSIDGCEECYIQRKPINEQEEAENLDITKAQLISLFSEFGSILDIDVTPYQFTKSGKQKAIGNAHIKFDNFESVLTAAKAFDRKENILGCGRIHLSTNFINEYKLPGGAFQLLKENIKLLKLMLKQGFSCQLFIKELDDNVKTNVVSIKANNFENLNKSINLANTLLIPFIINLPYYKYDIVRKKLNKDNFQLKIQNELHVFICKDSRFNQIKIYGVKGQIKKAFNLINNDLEMHNAKFVEIFVSSFKAFSRDVFLQLNKEFRGEIQIDFKAKKITFISKNSMAEKFKAKIKEIEEKYNSTSKNNQVRRKVPKEVCLICDDKIENKFTLVSCKHSFCFECLRHQFESMDISSSKLACVQCEKAFFVCDIKRLANYNENIIEQKCLFALNKALLNDLKDKFKYCSTCNAVCKINFKNDEYVCDYSCKKSFCLKCNRDLHHGFTCEEIKSQNDKFDAYKKEFTKSCPKCKVSIEKNDGCNHMECFSCKAHFCWHCLIQGSQKEVYDHLIHKHGGIN